MSEDLKFKGRLGDKELEEMQLSLRIKGFVTSLRDLLDPTEEIEDLDSEMILDQALQLNERRAEHIKVKAKIKLIKKTLGK